MNSALHATITPTLAQKQQLKETAKGFHLGSWLSVDWNSQECEPRNNYFEYVGAFERRMLIPLLVQKMVYDTLSPTLSQ